MSQNHLEAEFDQAMMNVYLRAKSEVAYTATVFHGMLMRMRGVETARQLINNRQVSDGYAALWERGRLDLTVEAVVVDNPKWHALFADDEIRKARKRLEDYGYFEGS